MADAMETPGKFLKKTREEKGKSLEDLSKLLKIRCDYLKAIEDEDYQSLPGEVFIKGYIRIYAKEMGVDSDYALGLYKKQIAAAQLPEPPSFTQGKKSLFTYKLIGIILSVTLVILSIIFFITHKSQRPDVRLVKAINGTVPALTEEPKVFSLEIIATEETWVSVDIDKDKHEQRLLKTGEAARWNAVEGFSVKIGNAGGARLVFNGKTIGSLGPSGKVVRLVLPDDNLQDGG